MKYSTFIFLSFFLIVFNMKELYSFINDKDSTNFPFKMSIYGEGIHLFEGKDVTTIIHNTKSGTPIENQLPEVRYKYPSDNPLIHSSFFFDLNIETNIYNSKLKFDIIAEHRGVSYGVFNTKSMIVFPKYYVGIDTNFNLFGNKIKIGTNFGNYKNQVLYEGLQFYNLDYQGIEAYIKTGKLKFTYHQIGDLTNYIGLRIDEAFNFIFSIEDIKYSKNLSSDIKFGIASIQRIGEGSYPDFNYPQYNLSINLSSSNFRAYSQIGYRSSKYIESNYMQSALLFGFEHKLAKKRYKLSSKIEYRYYGQNYNLGYIDKNVHYRNKISVIDSSGYTYYLYTTYNNTIGTCLYPLERYDSFFSQWAVYTEYQNQNINAITYLLDFKYNFYNSFNIKVNLDLNLIKSNKSNYFIYPFYNIGFQWAPKDKIALLLSLTNKGMNLDKHYPTFYLYNSPQIFMSFKYNFNLINNLPN